jgi:integrase
MKGSIIKRGNKWAVILDTKDERGKRRRKWHSGYKTKKEAEAACAGLITAMNTGNYSEPSKITVGEHVRDRIEQWRAGGKVTLKTIERYVELLDNQITPFIGSRLLQKLSATDIERWHTVLRERGRKDGGGGVSDRTIRQAHMLLRHVLGDAQRFDLIPKNVAALQGLGRSAPREEVEIIGENRIDELLAKMRGRALYCKLFVALFTGIRRGELLGMQWRDLDLDAKTMSIERALEETHGGVRIKLPKTAAGRRTISMPEIVIDALRDHRRATMEQRLQLGLGKLADDAFVFSNFDGKHHSPSGLSVQWRDTAKAIGFEGTTWHSFRHTHASMLIASNMDIVQLSKRLGHSSPTVTLNVYSHLYKREDKAAEVINAALANLGRG